MIKHAHNTRTSKKVKIDSVEYPSMSAAERELDINRKTIAGRLESPSFPNYEFLGLSKNPKHIRSRPVCINGVEYNSINQASIQLGISSSVIQRKLKDDDDENFEFI